MPEIDARYQVGDTSHYELVFAQDQQYEAAGDAGEDHRANGDRTAEEYEPEGVWGLSRGEGADDCAEQHTEDEQKSVAPAPSGYPAEDEDRRRYNEAEEEGPCLDRVPFEQILHKPCEHHHAEADADYEREQECAVDVLPKRLELSFQQHAYRIGVDRGQRAYKFVVYAHDEGDCASGHARNDVCSAHTCAFDCHHEILYKSFHPFTLSFL